MTNLAGKTFTRLTVIALSENGTLKHPKWICRCECGKEVEAGADNLRRGATKSCGCLNRERRRAAHDASIKRFPEYFVWQDMIRRCRQETRAQFKDYGGRGITVCERWKRSFRAFLMDMGPRPTPRHTIERVNNDGNYEPGNCKWATRIEQGSNKRNNRRITFAGETRTVADWARKLGMIQNTLRTRLFQKRWPIEKAFTFPLRAKGARQ